MKKAQKVVWYVSFTGQYDENWLTSVMTEKLFFRHMINSAPLYLAEHAKTLTPSSMSPLVILFFGN